MKNRFILLLYTLLASLSSCTNAVQADTHEPRIFEYASIYIPGSETAEATSLGLNSIDSDWGLWGHNLSSVLPAKPSQTIYAKQNGSADRSQFCFSSNQLYEYIESYIIDHYGERKRNRFAILPNDNDHVCTCPECTAAGNTKQDASPALFRLISRLAERFPNHLFFTSYYRTTRSLPAQPLPENTGVLISTMDYPLSTAATPDEQRFMEQLRRWTAATSHVYVWDYINNFDDYFTPFPVFGVMQRRFEQYAAAGVKGIFLNGSGTDYSSLSRLRLHLLAAQLADPQLDWRSELPALCRKLYPVTGETIAAFLLRQEDFVARKGVALPLYEGITKEVATYLPEEEFTAFYHALQELRPQTSRAERQETDRLCGALALTALELKRLHGDTSGTEPLLAELEQLLSQKIEIYNEACWTIEAYLRDYRYMLKHAAELGERDLLRGAKLNSLSPLDPDYRDLSILTDGVLGLPSNYHSGHVLSSEPTFQIAFRHVPGMRHLRVWLTRNLAYRIALPLRVLLTANGKSVGVMEPQKSAEHPGHAFVEFDLPASAEGTLVLTLVRDPDTRTMAVSEIEAY